MVLDWPARTDYQMELNPLEPHARSCGITHVAEHMHIATSPLLVQASGFAAFRVACSDCYYSKLLHKNESEQSLTSVVHSRYSSLSLARGRECVFVSPEEGAVILRSPAFTPRSPAGLVREQYTFCDQATGPNLDDWRSLTLAVKLSLWEDIYVSSIVHRNGFCFRTRQTTWS